MEIAETYQGFVVTFQYDPAKVQALKDIPGAWFHRATKTWRVPRARAAEVNKLRQKYGVTALGNYSEAFEEIVPQEIPELPDLNVHIDLKRKLFPFQEKGVAYCMRNRRVIIGDQPGLGKTAQLIATAIAVNAFPVLVICPATLKLNWQKEWMDVAGRRSMILTDSVKNTWQQYYRVGMIDVFIVNYESLKKFFVAPGWSKPKDKVFRMKDIPFRDSINLFKLVAIDESHKCKDGSTQQAKFVMGICKGVDYVFELSGTPIVNKPKDLIPQLIIVDRLKEIVSHIPVVKSANGKMDYSGYTRFINRYCGGGMGATNLKELNYRLASTCFYRREKSEVLKDLPPKIRQVILCEITNREEYSKAENDFVNYLKNVRGCTDQEIRKKLRGEIMVKMGILKQISAHGKINEVRDWIDDIVESGEKVVVFAHLKEIVRTLCKIYPDAVTITGDDDTYSRQRNIESFQNDPDVKIIFCSITAAGVGITLTASSRVGFIEFPWTFAACEQCEDRTHRIGQHDSVQAAYFLGEKTIDRYCYELIQKKKTIAQTVTGASDDVQEEIIDELLNLFNQR
jgi:SWI/SNF-related matrix-associated actin-dependent regulator 1 of chromatin subfamily A